MNFSSLVHGAVGAIVCDSLLLHELASLSRVSSLVRKLVEYKYSHLKYLNLSDELMISKMTLENFSLMCHRLKGIEVLHLPDLSSIGGINGNSTADSDSVEADSTAVSTPAALSLSSTPTSTVNAAAPPDNDALIDLPPPTTASSSDSQNVDANPRLQYLFTLLDNNSTSLRVLSQPKITRQKANKNVKELIQEYLQHNLNQFTSLEVIAWSTGMSFQEYVKKKKKKTTSGSDCDIKREIFSLNTVDQYFQLNTRVIAEYIKFLPQLKTFFWVSIVDEKDWNKEPEQGENSSNTSNTDSHTSSTSSISFFEIERGRSLIVPLWSNLLVLSILGLSFRDGILNPTRIELNLPHLLQLGLESLDLENLVDVSFNCPELIALRYGCPCRIQPLELTLKPTAGFLYEGHRYKSAPSFLSSLRLSPKIRNLNYNLVVTFLTDYSDSLTNDETSAIIDKSKQLGLTSPFDMLFDEHQKMLRANRIFCYALSLLPCVNTLEMIEFAPSLDMDLIEYCALFPNLRSISQISPWFFTPHWFRPHESEDESYYKYIHKRITKECEKRADRMYTPKDLNECLSVRDHEPVSVFNFCASGLELKLDTLKTLSSTSMFTQLKSIFLTSPVTIESSAVISLIFLTCQQLEHASLMQLDSINNTVFTSLPHDCIRPSLVTLRIKTPCDIVPAETLTEKPLQRHILPRLFPSLHHLEYLLMANPSDDEIDLLECVPNAIDCLSEILEEQNPRRDWNEHHMIVDDDLDVDGDSDLVHSPSSHRLWPLLTTLIVRSCPTRIVRSESASARLSHIFSHRFHAAGDMNQHQQHHLTPTLTFVELIHEKIDLALGIEAALCWNLPPRQEVARRSLQPESTLTVIKANETSHPEHLRPCFCQRREERDKKKKASLEDIEKRIMMLRESGAKI